MKLAMIIIIPVVFVAFAVIVTYAARKALRSMV